MSEITLDFSKLSDEEFQRLDDAVWAEGKARKRINDGWQHARDVAKRYFATADRTVTLQVRDDVE